MVTVVPGGSLNCAVNSPQDTDFWKLTPDIEGVQNLMNPVDDSGDLTYAWTSNNGGTFDFSLVRAKTSDHSASPISGIGLATT